MKKFDFSKPLLAVNGQPFVREDNSEIKIKDLLAQILFEAKGNDAMKLFNLSQTIDKAKGAIELDTADVNMIKKTVKEDKVRNAGILGQILEVLEA